MPNALSCCDGTSGPDSCFIALNDGVEVYPPATVKDTSEGSGYDFLGSFKMQNNAWIKEYYACSIPYCEDLYFAPNVDGAWL